MYKSTFDKITYALFSSLLMISISSPQFLTAINKDAYQCPNNQGPLLALIIYFISLYALMMFFNFFKQKAEQKNWVSLLKYSFYSALIFYFVNSQSFYIFTDKLFNCLFDIKIVGDNGCPIDLLSIIIHSIMFFFILIFGI
jgi:hypothetical protein